jgi:hypothetical protein
VLACHGHGVQRRGAGEKLPPVVRNSDVHHARHGYQALQGAASPDEAKSKITAVVQKFSTYITELAGSLPSKAFKAETCLTTALKEVKVAKAEAAAAQSSAVEVLKQEFKPCEGCKSPGDCSKAMKCSVSKGEMSRPSHVTESDWEAMDDTAKKSACMAKKEETVVEPVAKSEVSAQVLPAAGVEQLMTMIADLGSKFAQVVEKVDGFGQEITSMKEAQQASDLRVDSAVKKFDTAAKTMEGVVLAEPASVVAENSARRAVVQKTDDPRGEPLPANFDSSVHRRVRTPR